MFVRRFSGFFCSRLVDDLSVITVYTVTVVPYLVTDREEVEECDYDCAKDLLRHEGLVKNDQVCYYRIH